MEIIEIPEWQDEVVLCGHYQDTEILIRERPEGRRKRLYVDCTMQDSFIRNIGGFDECEVRIRHTGTRAQRHLGYSHWRNGPSKVELDYSYGTPYWFAGLNEGKQGITCRSYRLGYTPEGENVVQPESGMWLQGKIDTGGAAAVYHLDIQDIDSAPFREGFVEGCYRYGVVVEASPGPTVNVHAKFNTPNWWPLFDVAEVEKYDTSEYPNLENANHTATGVVKGLRGENVHRHDLTELW